MTEHTDVWNGVYETTKDFHLGSLQMDVKRGQLIIVRGPQIEINFSMFPNPDFPKIAKAGLAEIVDMTEEQAQEIWKDKLKNSEEKVAPKVPMATWRG